jgi:hypothetical protein
MVYYIYECYGGEGWDPKITGEKINAIFKVSDGFSGNARCDVIFRRKSLEEMKAFAPGIETIDKKQQVEVGEDER